MASKLISKGVLVEFYANLLAVVVESFIKDRLKRYSRHFVDGPPKRDTELANSVVAVRFGGW